MWFSRRPGATGRQAWSEGVRSFVGKLLNISVAVGFGCFFAWQHALVSLMFPVSFGMTFSPLVCQALAGCLVSVVVLLSFVKNRGTFAPRSLRVATAAAVVLGSIAAVLVACGVAASAPWSFVCAAVVGFATAVMFYAWAEVVSGLGRERRAGTVLAGVAVASVLSYALGWCSEEVPPLLSVGIAVLGACALAGFAMTSLRVQQQMPVPLVFRPARTSHFRLLFVAMMLYAFVFGSVSGSTAVRASEITTCEFNMNMALAMLVVAAVLMALLALVRRPVHLSSMGRFLTPVLALLFLCHILLQGSGNGWLPVLTLGFWQLVQVFVLLLIIELAQSGYASLVFVFPLGWSFILLGFTCGALFGQVSGLLYGDEAGAVQSITVVLVIVAVVASSILAAAQYPKVLDQDATSTNDKSSDAGAALDEGATPVAAAVPQAAVPTRPSVPPDPIALACADLVARHALSGREEEVLELLARGNTRASIADKLCISENTVRVHVKNIYAKLRIHSKQQLIDMVDQRAK